jgi:hypothetical protein
MQKKLYFLNEEEKNRILNLHESRTRKQYLTSEQLYKTPEWMKQIPTKGVLNTEELQTFKKIKPQWDMATPIGKACKTLGKLDNRIVDSEEQIKGIVKKINDTFYESNHSLYMDKQYVQKMSDIMLEFKSVPDLCFGIEISSDVIAAETTSQQFPTYTINNNFLKLFWDVFANFSLLNTVTAAGVFVNTDAYTINKTVYSVLKEIIKKSEDISKGVASTIVQQKGVEAANVETSKENVAEWPKEFSCILTKKGIKDSDRTFNNDKWKQVSYTNGIIEFYSSSGLFYKKYKDGGVLPAGDDNYWTYYCENNKPFIKETIKTIKDKPSTPDSGVGQDTYTPPLASGIGTTTRSVNKEIPTLLKQVGVEGTSLTQDAINKLYDKLSKKA